MAWVVHVGGLVRTGSGAVKDALLDTGCFLSLKGKSFAMSESRLFSGRIRIPAFVARVRGLGGSDVLALWTNGTRLSGGETLRPATRGFLRLIRQSHGINRKFLLKADPAPLRAAAEETAASISAARTGTARKDAYILGTRRAMRSLLPLDGRMIVVNNDPAVSWDIGRHLRLDPESVFVGVIRNPSDQYVDRRTGINPQQSRPVNLVYMVLSALLTRRALSALSRTAEEFPERCFIVEFERFASETAYRERLMDTVLAGAPPRGRERPARFEAARSAQNTNLAVPRRDRLQHAVYTRLLAGPYQRAKERSGPDVWPEVATPPGSR